MVKKKIPISDSFLMCSIVWHAFMCECARERARETETHSHSMGVCLCVCLFFLYFIIFFPPCRFSPHRLLFIYIVVACVFFLFILSLFCRVYDPCVPMKNKALHFYLVPVQYIAAGKNPPLYTDQHLWMLFAATAVVAHNRARIHTCVRSFGRSFVLSLLIGIGRWKQIKTHVGPFYMTIFHKTGEVHESWTRYIE